MTIKITLITGPSNSGKTSYILKNLLSSAYTNVFFSKTDLQNILPLDFKKQGIEFDDKESSISINNKKVIFKKLPVKTGDVLINEKTCAILDEVQFLDNDEIDAFLNFLKENKVSKLIVSGLSRSWNGIEFKTTKYIETLSSDIIKIQGYCKFCKTPTSESFTDLKDLLESGSSVKIGKEFFFPCCEKCSNNK